MTAINFPDNPQVNDEHTVGSHTWKWTGSSWISVTSSNGPTGPTGATGPTGPTGPQGSFGGASFDYNYLTNTTESDPGSGNLKFNNTLTSATALFIDILDINAVDVTNYLQTIDDSTSNIKGHFRVSETANSDNYVYYAINGSHAHDTGYFHVPIAYLSGSVTSFADGLDVTITFVRTGDKGDTGPTGATGADAPTVTAINAQTASYTLVLSDKNKMVEMNVGSSNNLTIPPNSSEAFEIGTTITVLQVGSGQTTIVAGSGVTVNATPGLKLRAQWSLVTLVKRATDTWVVSGDLTA